MPRLWWGVVTTAVFAVIAITTAGEILSRPAPSVIGQPPAELHASSIRLTVSHSQFVAGWFVRGKPGHGAVLLLHGVRANRLQMLGRARFLATQGYSVLLVDLPAHGESSGKRITFGAREAAGVSSALAFLRSELAGESIGVIGVSLGAASLVLSRPSEAPNAVVLESMYPTIAEAVTNRLVIQFGPVGAHLSPVLLWQLPLRVGVTQQALRPIVALPDLQAPLLIVTGTVDRHTTWAETERIFAAAKQPKELWAVQGAAHVDLHSYAPSAYEARILKFFARYLRNAT
jgi:uncharacterized protein